MQTDIYPLLSKDLVERAFDLVAPSIELLFSSEIANRRVLVVNVVNPRDGIELSHRVFGDLPHDKWSREYKQLALEKAELAHEHKMNTAMLVHMFPHLMQHADVKFRGGVFYMGIPVGSSGTQGYIDEMVGRWVAVAIVGLIHLDIEPSLKDNTSAYL